MTAPPGIARHPQQHGTPGRNRVSKAVRHRLALALTEVAGMRFADSRAVIAGREALGETPDEIEAYLRATFRSDPVGVTAVRNVSRGGGGLDGAA